MGFLLQQTKLEKKEMITPTISPNGGPQSGHWIGMVAILSVTIFTLILIKGAIVLIGICYRKYYQQPEPKAKENVDENVSMNSLNG